VTVRDFCVLADDLTGALDAAAPLATRFGQAPVVWTTDCGTMSEFQTENIAIDAGTRNLSPDAAARRMAELSACLTSARISFLKIDSLFRGNFPAECAALVKSGAFSSAVVAPAFPAQNRLTKDAQQFSISSSGTLQPVGENILHSLGREVVAGQGIPLRHVPAGAIPTGAALFVCDALNDDDLHALVHHAEQLPRPLLFVGSAGLARKLGAQARPVLMTSPESRLVIAGSGHAVTRAQIAHALGVPGVCHIVLSPGSSTLLDSDSVLAEIDVRDCAPDTHLKHLTQSLHAVHTHLRRPDRLLVSGGDTFRAVLEASGGSHLTVDGEIAPGIATGAIRGGAWDGVRFVSKSGAFGAPDQFSNFLSQADARMDL